MGEEVTSQRATSGEERDRTDLDDLLGMSFGLVGDVRVGESGWRREVEEVCRGGRERKGGE